LGKVYQRAVMRCPGIIFPTPYPQGYGATPPLPRPPQSACDVPGSMPEAAPYGNAGCVVHRARVNGGPSSATSKQPSTTGHAPAPQSHGTARSAPKRGTPGRRRRSDAGKRRRGGVQLFTGTGRPRGVRHIRRPGRRYTHRPDTATRPGSAVPVATCRVPPRPPGHRGRTGAVASSGSCAGQTTDSGLRNHIFSANFSPLPIPWGIGRSTPLPPGKKRPGGTLPPDGDGPRMRGALPCTASG
jgi:hypothetical protein